MGKDAITAQIEDAVSHFSGKRKNEERIVRALERIADSLAKLVESQEEEITIQ
jgi:hypothetical protein